MIKKLLAVVAAAFLLGACDDPAPQSLTRKSGRLVTL